MSDSEAITNAKIYEEIIRSKSELKNIIEASETRLLLKVEELKSRLNILEKENLFLKNKLENLENTNKKNNIIVYGLRTPEHKITPEYICEKLNLLLSVDLKESDINNAYCLGVSETSPVKVELISYIKKLNILQNGYKLKGTKVFIAHDLTFKQR